MDRLQELVRLHRLGTGPREVARLLGMSPNTERRYREQLIAAGLLDGSPDELPSLATLRSAVHDEFGPRATPEHERSSVEAYAERIEALWRNGAGPQAIYDRLRLDEDGFAGSLSAIKRLCLRLKKIKGVAPNDVVIPIEVVLGEAQVDFGYVGKLYDAASGQMRKTWVFVMTLAGSGKMVTRLVFDQKVSTWLRLHIESFEELGGVPTVVIPDNLKAAVLRAAFALGDNPSLNRSYRELRMLPWRRK
jgi:transposase